MVVDNVAAFGLSRSSQTGTEVKSSLKVSLSKLNPPLSYTPQHKPHEKYKKTWHWTYSLSDLDHFKQKDITVSAYNSTNENTQTQKRKTRTGRCDRDIQMNLSNNNNPIMLNNGNN